MKKLFTVIIIFMGFSVSSAQSPPPDTTAPYYALDSLQQAIDRGLLSIKMHRSDLTFRSDYLEEDPYRLQIVNDYMKEPLKMIDLAGSTLGMDSFADFKYENLLAANQTKLKYNFSTTINNNSDSLTSKDRVALGPDLTNIITGLLELAKQTDYRNWDQFKRFTKAQRDSLAEGFTLLLEENVEDEFRSVDQLDSISQYEDKWAQKLDTLANGCQGRGKLVDSYLNFLSSSFSTKPRIPSTARHYTLTTSYGDVIIGDTTGTHYQGDLFIVIDPGGNDTYDIRYDGIGHQTYIFDYSGNDVYNFPKNRVSPYFFGGNMIVDFEGDDIYNAGSWTLGAGLFGVGILWDKKGNDKYMGDTFTQGAGCFGVGILRDDEGNDSYQASLYAQGFGFIDGIGILTDSSGNDTYFAGGKYKDILRYKDHYLSLSQGFAYGIRPKMSAGIGLLIDKSGNDVYVSDIFGQGSSYWYGIGVLADVAGNDQYISFQYAQGAATHMTLGILYDASGDDNYSSKGVSQGCGHDRAAGILIDLGGNDCYTAYDLSQAAGSANGIGILADIRGDDAYIVRSALNTQGFGQERRDYGSVGLFIDLGGKDGYSGGIGHNDSWWSDSKWGAGMDQ
jgi:hypothetical protein